MATNSSKHTEAVAAAKRAAGLASKAVADTADQVRSLLSGSGVPVSSTSRCSFEVYLDKAGEYRWRLKAGNGRIIADSGEGYKRKSSCLHSVDLVSRVPAGIKVDDLT